jgi:hypothetical protein
LHLRQLRAKCDDAQDYLVGLIHAHLQVGGPREQHVRHNTLVLPACSCKRLCSCTCASSSCNIVHKWMNAVLSLCQQQCKARRSIVVQ